MERSIARLPEWWIQNALDLRPAPSSACAEPVARQLRRRRAAAWRCAPLSGGRPDPIDLLPWPANQPAEVVEPLSDFANELVQVWGFSIDQVEALLDVQRRAMP